MFKRGDLVICVDDQGVFVNDVIKQGCSYQVEADQVQTEVKVCGRWWLYRRFMPMNALNLPRTESIPGAPGPDPTPTSATDKAPTGERKNNGKLRWRNFPLFLIRPMIEVGHFGETKYATFNFLKGLTVLDCMDSLNRHLDELVDPSKSDIDLESNCHHLAHVAWNALVALYMIKTRPDLDDRYNPGASDDLKK